MNAQLRTALVVGASRGLGLGLAQELAARGWQVIGTARNPGKAAGLAKLIAGSDGRVRAETLDVDKPEDLDALAARLAGTKLNLLFLNAGISGSSRPIENTTPEDLQKVMLTNSVAPIRIAARLLPLVVHGGTVAFMTSLLGSIGDNTSGGFDIYRVSKAALNMLARSFVATTARERDVTVLNLHPGWVKTDMGGPMAPLTVHESVKGLVDVIEKRHGRRHLFLDYRGKELPW